LAEACNTAAYLLNRMPTAVLGGKTPHYALFKKNADLSHLRPFGCQAYTQYYDNEYTFPGKAAASNSSYDLAKERAAEQVGAFLPLVCSSPIIPRGISCA